MTTAYPLQWPQGWPRTEPSQRRYVGGTFGKHLTIAKARERVFLELERLGAETAVISSNLRTNLDGSITSNQRQPEDVGIAVYFTLKGKKMVMAQDRWEKVEANINALGLAIEYMRGLERHGGGVMMERAFTGFTALPPPKDWRTTLNFAAGEQISLSIAERRYRDMARGAHPDHGGSDAALAELNLAIKAAREELGA